MSHASKRVLLTPLSAYFALSPTMLLTILSIVGLAAFGAYTLWERYAKQELLKKEENFDTLKEEPK